MNLYFRLIRVLFGLLWVKPIPDPFAVFNLTFHAWPFDLDLNMHMNNARYLSWMDLGRVDMMGRTGLLNIAFKRKWMPVVAHLDIRFIKSVKPFQKIRLETKIEKMDEKYFYIKQSFFHKNHLMAVAHVKGLLVNKRGKVSPQEVVDAVIGRN